VAAGVLSIIAGSVDVLGFGLETLFIAHIAGNLVILTALHHTMSRLGFGTHSRSFSVFPKRTPMRKHTRQTRDALRCTIGCYGASFSRGNDMVAAPMIARAMVAVVR
jgi:hypothetical protein